MSGPDPARQQRPGPLAPGLDRAELLAAVTADLAHLGGGARVLVALSGGPDSTALAYLATEARPDLVVTLVHVRHGLRDDTEDVAVVERHAAYLGLPLEVVAVRVARSGRGLEAAARDARYAAIRAVAAERDAEAILVGHTADDQAETVLLRAARGTGVAGLAAMRGRSGDLVRPLLRVRRTDLRRFVAMEGLPVAMDPTNHDPNLRRVRVRSDLLPRLAEVGPDPVGALGRLAALAAEDEDALTGAAGEALAAIVWRRGDVIAVRDEDLARFPLAVGRRVWRRVLAELGAGGPPSAAVVSRLLALGAGRRLHVGALEVTAGGGWRTAAVRTIDRSPPRPLATPGVTPWTPAEVAVSVVVPGDEAGPGSTTGQIAFELAGAWTPPSPADAALAPPPGGWVRRCVLTLPAGLGELRLRHREPGDRLHTEVGTKRVADVLVDACVPRPVRDRWPLLVGGDRVLWIPGVAVDAEVHAAGRASPALQLALVPAPPACR
ncbi:MAG: tRNA lysidine(34) synthetase TilS [Nitriliruptor sp.]